jgi:hypothetical protein
MRGRQTPVLKSLVRQSMETTVAMPMGQLISRACGLVQLELDREVEVLRRHVLVYPDAVDEFFFMYVGVPLMPRATPSAMSRRMAGSCC